MPFESLYKIHETSPIPWANIIRTFFEHRFRQNILCPISSSHLWNILYTHFYYTKKYRFSDVLLFQMKDIKFFIFSITITHVEFLVGNQFNFFTNIKIICDMIIGSMVMNFSKFQKIQLQIKNTENIRNRPESLVKKLIWFPLLQQLYYHYTECPNSALSNRILHFSWN